jgi:ABC-type cobalt transport system substrate-binding protein|tara:strand:+ start:203 stop:457 length:255 start_codon:yes stop_codon:yes gene_type:complete
MLKKNILIFFIILLFLLIVLCFCNTNENFISNNGMGSDVVPSFNGPYDYEQDPLLNSANNSNKGMGSDVVSVFNGPYNVEQNPL